MGSPDLIETGKTVLRTEGEAILRLTDELGASFEQAVNAMYAAKGRVIVTGMGKSGHVGAKIAATLASTGTPAQFVHPGEASHGDLGMITRDDVTLVLSNSGETAELADIIAHVLARVEELMHTGAEIPTVAEGDPMSEVLITISQKGFGVAAVLTETGTLAGIITDGDLRRNMDGLLERTAKDVMTENPTTITPNSRASAALLSMNERKITCLFVCEETDKTPIGILHIHDCLRAGVD